MLNPLQWNKVTCIIYIFIKFRLIAWITGTMNKEWTWTPYFTTFARQRCERGQKLTRMCISRKCKFGGIQNIFTFNLARKSKKLCGFLINSINQQPIWKNVFIRCIKQCASQNTFDEVNQAHKEKERCDGHGHVMWRCLLRCHGSYNAVRIARKSTE